ncbi:transcriptional repressor [Lysobacter sp. GCM10012299]|uniref:transcriptional repressor n=1 Tax=Lysobacter sp. GCM10012299 TaxID=3317333 RepID=UPI0036123F3E
MTLMSHDHACTDPKHHVHDGDAFVQEVERSCEQRGLRLTPIRAHALRLIADAGRPVKAYELLDQMKATHDAAAPPTVYRALDFLLEHGFIHKLASINAYVGCHHPGAAQHAVPFLICDRCQSATELEDERIVELLDARARALGFTAQAQTLEVHGVCADCAGKEAA